MDTDMSEWGTVTSARHADRSYYPKWIRPYTVGGHAGDHALVVLSMGCRSEHTDGHDTREAVARLAVRYGTGVRGVQGFTARSEIGVISLAAHIAALDVHASLTDYPMVADLIADLIDSLWPLKTWPLPKAAEARKAATGARKMINLWVDNPATLHTGLKSLIIAGTSGADRFPVALHHLLRDTARTQARNGRLPAIVDRHLAAMGTVETAGTDQADEPTSSHH